MKKLVTFILVLCLVLGMGTVALAEGYEDWETVTIKKIINVNEGAKNPAETFEFTIEEEEGAPAFPDSTFTIDVAEGKTSGETIISLPSKEAFGNIGVYNYEIKEKPVNTAGMTYDTTPKKLTITVVRDDEGNLVRVVTVTGEDEQGNPVKVDAFRNSFYAGSLTIEKKLAGNYRDYNDEFEITVTLDPEGKVLDKDIIQAEGATDITQSEETGVVTIKYEFNGEKSFTIANIPYGVEYKVEETNKGDYEVSYTGDTSGTINSDNSAPEIIITNTRDIDIDAGVLLDNAPYIAILAVAIGGLALFLIRRRMAVNL